MIEIGLHTLGIGAGARRDVIDAPRTPRATIRRRRRASGEFARFAGIRVNPKPVRGGIPVVLGGNSDAALRRVAGYGDGWYGFNLPSIESAAERVRFLHALAGAAGRDPARLTVAVALSSPRPSDLPALAHAGVTQLVLVETPPDDATGVEPWIESLAECWLA